MQPVRNIAMQSGVTLSVKSSPEITGSAHQVEPRLRGATIGGEPSSPSEGYLKQPPQVGTLSL
jgi:hypothetical protein